MCDKYLLIIKTLVIDALTPDSFAGETYYLRRNEGDVVFTCKTYGSPGHTITWARNDGGKVPEQVIVSRDVDNNEWGEHVESTITISNSDWSDNDEIIVTCQHSEHDLDSNVLLDSLTINPYG